MHQEPRTGNGNHLTAVLNLGLVDMDNDKRSVSLRAENMGECSNIRCSSVLAFVAWANRSAKIKCILSFKHLAARLRRRNCWMIYEEGWLTWPEMALP
jgi:hypothetical protein